MKRLGTPNYDELMQLVADGMREAEIARVLHVSVSTVKNRRSKAITSFGARNAANAVFLWMKSKEELVVEEPEEEYVVLGSAKVRKSSDEVIIRLRRRKEELRVDPPRDILPVEGVVPDQALPGDESVEAAAQELPSPVHGEAIKNS